MALDAEDQTRRFGVSTSEISSASSIAKKLKRKAKLQGLGSSVRPQPPPELPVPAEDVFQAALPPSWRRETCPETGGILYVCAATGESSYDFPGHMPPPPLMPGVRHVGHTTKALFAVFAFCVAKHCTALNACPPVRPCRTKPC